MEKNNSSKIVKCYVETILNAWDSLVPVIIKDLDNFSSFLQEVPPFALCWGSIAITAKDLEVVLDYVITLLGIKKISGQFLKLIVHNNHRKLLNEIILSLNSKQLDTSNLKKAEVITAFPWDKQMRKDFEQRLKELLKGDFSFSYQEDKSIIDGYVLTLDNKLIDNSVKTKFKNLRRSILK